MRASQPSLSTDQVAAFVELARNGSLRLAAAGLHITEQGVRNRIVALEQRLGVELYRKSRGIRRAAPLTPEGQKFLPQAIAFLERAAELVDAFRSGPRTRDVHVAASQYLIRYVLIDAARKFRRRFPDVRIRLSTHAEREIESVLLDDPEVAIGVAAPYEPVSELDYQHVFSLSWSLIAPPRHRLAKRKQVGLDELTEEPLILFERGSTGRQHILEAFHERQLTPQIHMETTTTEIIVRMVEAGLGIALAPLLASGVVTHGRRVAIRPLADAIRPIHSGILTRRGEQLAPAAQAFVELVRATNL